MNKVRSLSLALALLLLSSLPVQAGGHLRGANISLFTVRAMVFTPDNQHAFLTGGTGNDEIFELDRDARVVQRRDGLGGAGDMIIEEGRMFVALEDENAIVELELPSLAEVDRFQTDPFEEIQWISKAGDEIYFSFGCVAPGETGVGVIDLSTGIARDTGISDTYRCIEHEAVSGGTQLLAFGWDGLRLYALDPLIPVLLREREMTNVTDWKVDDGFLYLLRTRLLEKISLETLETVKKEVLPDSGDALSLDPSGGLLAVNGAEYESATVYRAEDLERERSIIHGHPSEIILFEGGRKLMYAANRYYESTLVGTAFGREKVAVSRRMELDPSAGGGYVAWASGSVTRPRWENIYLKTPQGKVSRLRTPGAEAFPGAIDDGKLIHQQVRKSRSDLYLYDIDTGTTSAMPREVNSAAWEWRPSLSGRWVLFSRISDRGPGKIMLFDRETQNSKTIYRAPSKRVVPLADQVNGNHAVWTICSRVCSVFKHDISRGETQRVPNRWPLQFSASIETDGTMYYGKAGRGCGNHPGIVRHEAGEEPRVITVEQDNQDIDRVHIEPGSNPRRIYYTTYYCNERPLNTDIFFIEDP